MQNSKEYYCEILQQSRAAEESRKFTVKLRYGDFVYNAYLPNRDDEIAYFTVRWKTRELILSTAPKTWDNTDKDSKNRKRSH